MSLTVSTKAPFVIACALSLACVALASCAKGTSGEGGPDNPGSSTGGATIVNPGSGGTPSIKSDATVSTDSGAFALLPPPWQYYSDGSTFAYKDKSLADDVKDKFGGAPDTANKPVLVYPLDKSMHPNNLVLITFQWKQGGASNKVFKIEATAGSSKFDFYVPCTAANGQCTYDMPYSEWLDIAGRQQATLIVYGTDGAGGAVSASDPITLDFSPDPVMGGLYYWAESVGIKRATFGSSKAVDFISAADPNSGTEPYPCVACHSLSRDGKRIAFTVTSQSTDDKPWGIVVTPTDNPSKPVLSPGPLTSKGEISLNYGSWPALSSDGSLVAVVGASPRFNEPMFFDVRDVLANGSRLDIHYEYDHAVFGSSYDIALHPEWSPDDTALAVTLAQSMFQPDMCFWDHLTCKSTIGVMPWNGATLDKAVPMVQNGPGWDGAFHFYPTWSPDGNWIAFVSGRPPYTTDAGAAEHYGILSSYDAKDGVLRVIPSDINGAPYMCPGPKCIELTNATQYTWADAVARNGRGSTLPKFAPFAQGPAGNMFFITYTSRIDYGFTTGDIRQLWMSAVDMSKVSFTGGGDSGSPPDPSHVPFWVPYQAAADKNVEPYWTQVLSCTKDPKGGCQGCVGGESCVTNNKNECHCEVSVK